MASETGTRWALGQRFAPARFILFLILSVAGFAGWRNLFGGHGMADSLAMGFDFGATAFLVSLWPLLRECDALSLIHI